MDRYSAVTEYLLDCRIERVPSWDVIVFWRDIWAIEDEEPVEVRETREGCIVAAKDLARQEPL